MDIATIISDAWRTLANKVAAFLPNLVGALIILVGGWIVARVVKRIALRILKLINFEKATDKAGIKQVLEKGEVKRTPSELIGALVYWFIMLIVFVATLNALGLPIVSDLLNEIFLYIPKVIAALVVLVLGLFLANFLSATVQTVCSNAGLAQAENLGKITRYIIIIFASAMALQQLGIAGEIVVSAFVLIFGALCLGFALAFGLGGKEVAGDYLKKWLERKKQD